MSFFSLVFGPSYELIFLHLLCMNSHSGANTGATLLLTLARFFLKQTNKKKSHICIFISKYLLFKNDMLVYRLTVHQQRYFYYFRADVGNETRLHAGRGGSKRFFSVWTGLVLYQTSDVF